MVSTFQFNVFAHFFIFQEKEAKSTKRKDHSSSTEQQVKRSRRDN